jgi:hypothetical protein
MTEAQKKAAELQAVYIKSRADYRTIYSVPPSGVRGGNIGRKK